MSDVMAIVVLVMILLFGFHRIDELQKQVNELKELKSRVERLERERFPNYVWDEIEQGLHERADPYKEIDPGIYERSEPPKVEPIDEWHIAFTNGHISVTNFAERAEKDVGIVTNSSIIKEYFLNPNTHKWKWMSVKD